MRARRILYGLALVGAFLLQTVSDFYLAYVLFLVLLTLPLLSLLLSLPAILRCRVQVIAQPVSALRGGDAAWQCRVDVRGPFPLPRVKLRAQSVNLLTGEAKKHKLLLKNPEGGEGKSIPADTAHCGVLRLTVTRARALDHLGLFAIPIRVDKAAFLPVEPIPAYPGELHLPETRVAAAAGAIPSPSGLSEEYELREYRPGDPLRTVHWKLSTKWNELIVREPSRSSIALPLLTADRFGPPEKLDRMLDKLAGYSHALLAVQRPHTVAWLDEVGHLNAHLIMDEKELRDCFTALLSTPAPLTPPVPQPGEASPGDALVHIHVTAGEEDAP